MPETLLASGTIYPLSRQYCTN